MKTKAQREKALALYINSVSIEKIAKKLEANPATIKRWKKRYDWNKVKQTAIEKSIENAPQLHQKIVDDQIDITMSTNQLIKRFLKSIKKYGSLGRDENQTLQILTKIMTHGLEVVRPKTVSQYNFMKQENLNFNIELKKLLEATRDGTGI